MVTITQKPKVHYAMGRAEDDLSRSTHADLKFHLFLLFFLKLNPQHAPLHYVIIHAL
jgi:hypothetical protein